MWNIGIGTLMILSGAVWVGCGIRDYWNAKGYVEKAKVIEAFKDVEWSKETFSCGGGRPFIKDHKGREHFYPVDTIDAAIEKLNKVLNKVL